MYEARRTVYLRLRHFAPMGTVVVGGLRRPNSLRTETRLTVTRVAAVGIDFEGGESCEHHDMDSVYHAIPTRPWGCAQVQRTDS
ncbi:MAG: hypothetical protein EBX99_01925 [Acidimicrobiia bacterium]|nr:hypothetical protein [Actinomycetota bacterium]NDE59437.1 hypothetical protein [Acidimicrobiia bacterium]NDE80366.1 hypothetical protein [Actinomycetota bacterium]NDF31463.1 hypothetical protein [Acidimicrobiia bacterium]NDH46609.1 hypothetical protein [Acidimicrobiia bacterium]